MNILHTADWVLGQFFPDYDHTNMGGNLREFKKCNLFYVWNVNIKTSSSTLFIFYIDMNSYLSSKVIETFSNMY